MDLIYSRTNQFAMTRARKATTSQTIKEVLASDFKQNRSQTVITTVKSNPSSDIMRFVNREKPNLGLSRNLSAETNTYKGVVIK